MRVTAILNLKGGVAKTTTAVNMAAILAKAHGKRVLLVDADSQCNTTEFYHGDASKGGLSQLLRTSMPEVGTAIPAADYIQPTQTRGVDLIPADDSLMDLDLSSIKQGGVGVYTLRYLLSGLRETYDYVLIDCPPAFNAACAGALIAADDVVIPIKLDAFSLRGMGNLMRQIRNMRQINPKLKLAGVLPTMWYADDQIRGAEAQLADSGLHVFCHIRSSRKVDRMTWAQTPLSVCSPRSAAGQDYRRFVAEYMGGVQNGV